ncbi:hypothetical protein GEMRC1_006819 [Eukaryota sp. GEM-RC1]
MNKDTAVSSFLGDVLAIPQVHDLIGTNAEAFHVVFSFYSMNTDRLVENQFVTCIKRLNLNCENIPTPAVRQVFHELVEEYKGIERTKGIAPPSPVSGTMNATSTNPDSVGLGPKSVAKSLSFIQFVEGLIRLTYDKFAHLKQYTLCEKLEFVIVSRIIPHVEEIKAAKEEEERFTSALDSLSDHQRSVLNSLFVKYSSKDTRHLKEKDKRVTHAGWIKLLKDGMWIGAGVSMLSANNVFTKMTGEKVRSAVVGTSHGTLSVEQFFKAISMLSHVLYADEDPLKMFVDEVVTLKL